MTGIEHRHLRSALEYAVLIAAEGNKRRPPLSSPKDLRAFHNLQRLPASALGRVRRAVEGDADFRRAITAGAVPELVDDVGMLWLRGGDDWEAQAAEIIAVHDDEAASKDLREQLRRAEKRRVAAEQVAARTRTELLARDAAIADRSVEIDELLADLTKARDEIGELRAELVDTRNEVRHARDRERAARKRVDGVAGGTPVDRGDDRGTDAISTRLREVEVQLAAARLAADVERRRAEAVVQASREFVANVDALVDGSESPSSAPTATASGSSTATPDRTRVSGRGRVPKRLAGGVISTSAEAAEFLVRTDARMLVDGYNVAMLAWPDRTLEQQREALVGRCENLARRCGTDIVVVFDGSSVTGAHASSRRSVRVVFSPEGVSADDVIRSEVAALPDERHVVVVTNDREIVDDVRAAGANVVPSNAFIAVF